MPYSARRSRHSGPAENGRKKHRQNCGKRIENFIPWHQIRWKWTAHRTRMNTRRLGDDKETRELNELLYKLLVCIRNAENTGN